ncbi:hypothetical protein GCM10020331_065850 [Ectobacillus funiculus]
MYDPKISPREAMTKEEYRKSNDPSLNHFFYEKAVKIKGSDEYRVCETTGEGASSLHGAIY